MTTRVVHVNSQEWKDTPEDERVYIGRAVPRRKMRGSKWANPFPISAELSRKGAVDKYAAWVLTQPDLMASIEELRDKVVGCWCHPEPCHGDVLAWLADWTPEDAEEW